MAVPMDRQQLECDLLRQLRTTERAYRQAVTESKAVLERCDDLEPGNPDGTLERRRATAAEAAALEKYRRALKRFADLVVNNIEPPPLSED